MTDLLRYERIRTTQPRAEEVQREVERLITKARTGTLHARRQVSAKLYDEAVAQKLVNEIAPRFKDRPGGYTRMTKLGIRRGDSAPMAQLELVQ
jgi:large subunit ribosomal protein L17